MTNIANEEMEEMDSRDDPGANPDDGGVEDMEAIADAEARRYEEEGERMSGADQRRAGISRQSPVDLTEKSAALQTQPAKPEAPDQAGHCPPRRCPCGAMTANGLRRRSHSAFAGMSHDASH